MTGNCIECKARKQSEQRSKARCLSVCVSPLSLPKVVPHHLGSWTVLHVGSGAVPRQFQRPENIQLGTSTPAKRAGHLPEWLVGLGGATRLYLRYIPFVLISARRVRSTPYGPSGLKRTCLHMAAHMCLVQHVARTSEHNRACFYFCSVYS